MLHWGFTELFGRYVTPTVIEDVNDPTARGEEGDSRDLKLLGERLGPSKEEIRNDGGGR